MDTDARSPARSNRVRIEPDQLAGFALAVETEELGIAADLQDRIAQSYGGLTFMEFSEPAGCEQLDTALLPPALVAWRAEASGASGAVHTDLRARFHCGEPGVREAMAALGGAAREARAALNAGDHGALARSVDASFDARRAR